MAEQKLSSLREELFPTIMETIEKHYTSVSHKNIIQSHACSDRIFLSASSELLRGGHQIKFRAPGDSMYPTICDGDLITVKPIKPSNIGIGDIILYRHENGVVAHRVINIEAPIKKPSQNLNDSSQSSPPLAESSVLSPQHCFTLRGDAAIYYDDPVEAEQILGKVVSVERNGRSIDPYGLRSNLYFKARRLASRLKRFLLSHQPTST